MNFGFAISSNQGKLNSFLGTPNSVAQELHLRQTYYDITKDFFSLEVTIFVIISGTLPFKYRLKVILYKLYSEYWLYDILVEKEIEVESKFYAIVFLTDLTTIK